MTKSLSDFRVEVIGDCRLILGDCAEILPLLSGGYDLLTDPPYGINENSKKVASRGKLAKPKDYGDFEWDESPPQSSVIDIIRSITNEQIIFGGNYFDLPPAKCWLVWDKMNGSNDFADCELAWTNLNKAVRKIEWLWNGMIRKGSDIRIHPTQKPVGVMSWCVSHFTNPIHILDPYFGSGTTAIACIRNGVKFTGIEQNQQYFAAACRRIEEELKSPDLFVPQPEIIKPEQGDLLGD